jgi:hypothetical protein
MDEEVNTMATDRTASGAHVGDLVETRGLHGQPSRSGQIVELLGAEGHEHYRVYWDERHESILYPADGVIITPQHEQHARGSGR